MVAEMDGTTPIWFFTILTVLGCVVILFLEVPDKEEVVKKE
jgi:hypothetical protein